MVAASVFVDQTSDDADEHRKEAQAAGEFFRAS